MRSLRSFKLIAAGVLAMLVAPATAQQARPQAASSPRPVADARAALPGPQLTKADVDAWLDGYMPYALKRGDAAGAVVVVVKDGAILTQRGFGYADIDARKPVDPESTLFRQASVSKLFTWTAVMQMVEQGKIDLDRDVNAYLDFKIPLRDGKPITMRNLMTHTSGFDEVQRGIYSNDSRNIPPLGAFLKQSLPRRIFAPGTTPAYSNYATALAGYIVERVSGVPYDDYIERHIFAPAGMRWSTFRQPLPPRLQALMAKGYTLGSGKPNKFEMNHLVPAAGLTSSGADMGRFMIAHLDNGGALLKPATALQMHTSMLTVIPPLNRMALGFYEQNVNGREVLSHAGDTVVFHSQLWLFPNEKVGIYMSMNAAGTQGVSGVIRSQLLDSFADRYFPAEQHDATVDAATAREHARLMAGTYVKSRRLESSFLKVMELAGGQVKVGVDGKGALRPQAFPGLGGQARKWVEIAPFVWRDQDSKMRLAARVENGKVTRFSLDATPFMLFEPVAWYLSSAWLTPALLLSLGALLLTALSWPVSALVRRHYGAKLALTRTELKSYRLTRGFAALAVAVMLAWPVFITILLSDFSFLGGQLDWALILLQLLTPIAFLGLAFLTVWNLWLVWKGKRGRFSKVWSVVLLLSSIILLWVAVGFHLIGFGTSF
ncbi:beta-lactamase family protein [Sphingomonas sp. QA11]|uniref:serine hydrolase domain-containing protein n=1 Tax=Sphingomonas sp. QA11 TaxID=2950605 RepID=UPI00234A0B02|nr:serine hydrolase domain-containing protein [Sphingomonas sp. QA11]WCM28444.1 beta-lactamase family protein [Sphingomonas sp. QA11]